MEPDKVSWTALWAAGMRAWHVEHFPGPVFADPIAARLLTTAERDELRRVALAQMAKIDPELAARDEEAALGRHHRGPATVITLARARYADDVLTDAVAGGLTQYVLLGAGLDTFAWRRPDLAEKLTIFELDSPAMQRSKRQRVEMAGLAYPPNLHFGTVDFERESAGDVLRRLPYDPSRRTIFGWFGVTVYLTREAIAATLTSLREVAPPGSEVMFDYLSPAALTEPPGREARARGEPWLSGFEPAELPAALSPLGFEVVDDIRTGRYFEGRGDGPWLIGAAYVVRARVT